MYCCHSYIYTTHKLISLYRSEPIAPFCDRFDDRITKCTAGLYGRSQCQIKVWLNYLRLPLEYQVCAIIIAVLCPTSFSFHVLPPQYFNSNSDVLSRTIGGKILVKDFCPFEGVSYTINVQVSCMTTQYWTLQL